MKTTFLLVILLALCSHTGSAQNPHHTLQAEGLPAMHWISVAPERQKPNQWICFRKEIELDAKAQSVPMVIAVDSKYWLWINGRLVVFEGGLKRGPNPNDTYYDRIDIAPYLRKGRNTVALMLWYWGKQGFCHHDSGMSGLLANISLGDGHIVSDGTWRVMIHPSFKETGDPKPNYRLPESNVHFDARDDIGAWYKPGYDDSAWPHATVLGTYPCAPWGRLYERPFPNWLDSGIVRYVETATESADGHTVVTGTLPTNITVTPYIRLKADAGALIDIRTDNYKGGSEYNVRAEYVTKDGVQEFEMPNYVNGHRVIYTLPQGVKCLEVGYRETRFNTRHIGRFECSDPFYDTLWQKSLNTMNLNMRDAIQDPDRERSQWWGDAAIILHEIFYSCDTNGYAAVRKAILNLVDWQKEDGTLYSPIPQGSWDKELPLQMLASVGKYGFWSYYLYSGDKECIEYIYPKVKRYLALWETDAQGLVKHRAGGWDWADWGDEIDVAILDNAWYCLALESAMGMGRLLGDEEYVAWCDERRQRVSEASQKAFWNGTVFRSPQYGQTTDDRANAMALLAGFASPEQTDMVVDYLMSYQKASPYMERYVLESLFAKGYTDQALARMKSRYEQMVASPLTSLWEDWQIGGHGGGSINHGWAGGPLPLLSRYVAGVSPLTPGWKRILVHPQTGSLEWVKCTVPVFNDQLDVEVQAGETEWRLTVANGTGNECIVAIPQQRITESVTVSGKVVARAGEPIAPNDWIEPYTPGHGESLPEGCLLVRLKSDRVTITVE